MLTVAGLARAERVALPGDFYNVYGRIAIAQMAAEDCSDLSSNDAAADAYSEAALEMAHRTTGLSYPEIAAHLESDVATEHLVLYFTDYEERHLAQTSGADACQAVRDEAKRDPELRNLLEGL
ncbi:MAG: hypothetical protein ACP5DX_05205 [Paracoccaceae bacterium]